MLNWIVRKIQGIERVEIKCRFDDTVLGYIDITKSKWEKRHAGIDISKPESHGIEDSRCDACLFSFGNLKQMRREFIGAGGTLEKFDKHMKKNDYKNTRLKEAIKNLQEGKDPDAPRIDIV